MGALSTGQPTSGARGEVWLRQEVSLATQARRAAGELGRRIGLSTDRIAEIDLAVTETAVNLNKHAVDGALLLRLVSVGDQVAVELIAVDHGPGIADVGHVRHDGVSSAGTLGIGLGVVTRMADSLDVHSLPGRGTVLLARFRDRPPGAPRTSAGFPEPAVAGITRPLSGENVCGDAWAARHSSPGSAEDAPIMVMLCDGLGHGPLAALAGEQAVGAFHRTPSDDPKEILAALHQALAGTRGGAVAVAAIDPRARSVRYCGVGNISGFVVADGRRNTLLSAPGIVGHHLPRLRSFDAELPENAAMIMHSDGLTERWDPRTLPGLFRQSSTIIAAHLLREAGVRKDDASAVVVTGSDAAAGGAA